MLAWPICGFYCAWKPCAPLLTAAAQMLLQGDRMLHPKRSCSPSILGWSGLRVNRIARGECRVPTRVLLPPLRHLLCGTWPPDLLNLVATRMGGALSAQLSHLL